ncbi:hypothetical protein LAZ67_15000447 [Cordylochernes scorpioides]|uniref:Transposase n=1 Tax=Cordylochernes scorpioides TaxID=51811 RepID=A0ABY6L830_9ARAC|nr:hypothetical protein LAZ67_15000447 [Cordylochernes scorpioides]
MKAVYRYKCLFQNRIFEWVRKFKIGIESLDDAPRPGAPVKVSDDATTWAIDEVIQNDHNINIRSISAELNLIYVQKNLHKCVPWLLTKEMKEKRLSACEKLLERYEIEGKGFLDRILTVDESWIHHLIPDSKRSSAEWHHKGSPTPKKPRITASAGKVLLPIFYDSKGCILEYYLPKGQTVNSIVYSELLEKN